MLIITALLKVKDSYTRTNLHDSIDTQAGTNDAIQNFGCIP